MEFRAVLLSGVRYDTSRLASVRARCFPGIGTTLGYVQAANCARYRSDDAIGLFKGGKSCRVRVELSPTIAIAVTGRAWQHRQVITRLANGGALITLEDCDLDEVVRWAFSFAAEARIVGPPEAVARARELAHRVLGAYEAAELLDQVS